MRRLAHVRGAIIGAVLTKYDAKSAGYGNDYGYAYGYGGNVGVAHDQPVLDHVTTGRDDRQWQRQSG